jgi:hypothetical protein
MSRAGGRARELILKVFEQVEALAKAGVFLGCPFVSVAVEMKDTAHPATLVARRFKSEMTMFFERQARRLGVREPALLARQLTMAFDGASTQVPLHGRDLSGIATSTAAALIDAAEAAAVSLCAVADYVRLAGVWPSGLV